jgi:RNA polymerase subunit RPABC4/transcription elongation factor Spt4
VRFCLECGAVLPFEQRECPVCGAAAAEAGGPPGMPCRACGQALEAGRLFCPACGLEQDPAPEPGPAPPFDRDDGDAARLDLLAGVLAGLGPLVLLAAVLAVLAYAD